MQRNQNPGQNPRQPITGQPHDHEDDDDLQDQETVPSFLTARELQAREPAKATPRDGADEGEDDESEDELPAVKDKTAKKSR